MPLAMSVAGVFSMAESSWFRIFLNRATSSWMHGKLKSMTLSRIWTSVDLPEPWTPTMAKVSMRMRMAPAHLAMRRSARWSRDDGILSQIVMCSRREMPR